MLALREVPALTVEPTACAQDILGLLGLPLWAHLAGDKGAAGMSGSPSVTPGTTTGLSVPPQRHNSSGSPGTTGQLADQLSNQHLGTSPSSRRGQSLSFLRAPRRQASHLHARSDPGSSGSGKRARAPLDDVTFEEYEAQYGPAARCASGTCADVLTQPCKLHTCQACKKNRKLEKKHGSRARSYCGMCSRREVVSGLEFVRCCFESPGSDGQVVTCGVEMLGAVFVNHWKQHRSGGVQAFERIETDQGRICRSCTNLRPVTYYPDADTNCCCLHCQATKHQYAPSSKSPGQSTSGSKSGGGAAGGGAVDAPQLDALAGLRTASMPAMPSDSLLAGLITAPVAAGGGGASDVVMQVRLPVATASSHSVAPSPVLPTGLNRAQTAPALYGDLDASASGTHAPAGTPLVDTLSGLEHADALAAAFGGHIGVPAQIHEPAGALEQLLVSGYQGLHGQEQLRASMPPLRVGDMSEQLLQPPPLPLQSSQPAQGGMYLQYDDGHAWAAAQVAGAVLATDASQALPQYGAEPMREHPPPPMSQHNQPPEQSYLQPAPIAQVLGHLDQARQELSSAYHLCQALGLYMLDPRDVQHVVGACHQLHSAVQAVASTAQQATAAGHTPL